MSEAIKKLWQGQVLSDWIDYNGHLNDAYYAVAFSLASEVFLDNIGVYTDYRERTNCTVYSVETHISYLRELKEHDPIWVSCQLLFYDAKRIHIYLTMFHETEAYLAASYETMLLHVDQTVPKVSPMPEGILKTLAGIKEEQKNLKLPTRAGRGIALKKA